MADSSIEWTDKTWNPVTGCSKVSPGCAHCYADVRFISAEPLLGGLTHDWWDGEASRWSDGYEGPELDLTDIAWLIVGGESGKGHRPFNWDWARQLKYHCELYRGTAFFLKQGGGHRPGDRLEDLPEDLRIREYPSVGIAA